MKHVNSRAPLVPAQTPAPTVVMNYKKKDQLLVKGGIYLFLYLSVWFISIGSPALLYLLWQRKFYMTVVMTILVMISAFIPNLYRPFVWLQRSFREKSARYYESSTLVFESMPGEYKRPTLLCAAPHGCFCMGWGHLYLRTEDYLRGFTFCISRALFWTPLFRILTCLLGKPMGVSKQEVCSLMERKKNLAICIGGFEEATISSCEEERVYIKERKGFIKYALQYGYALLPVYTFGESKTYWNIQGLWKLRLKLNEFSLPTIFCWGVSWVPILPRPVRLYIVGGKHIELPHIPFPTKEEIDKWHDCYMQEMVGIFERHKLAYCEGDEKKAEKLKLQIW